mgnify:CR=1 FL=1
MKKRLASLQAGLLALVLLFSLLPVSSFATEIDAAPDSVITTQEDAADRNTAQELSRMRHLPLRLPTQLPRQQTRWRYRTRRMRRTRMT